MFDIILYSLQHNFYFNNRLRYVDWYKLVDRLVAYELVSNVRLFGTSKPVVPGVGRLRVLQAHGHAHKCMMMVMDMVDLPLQSNSRYIQTVIIMGFFVFFQDLCEFVIHCNKRHIFLCLFVLLAHYYW